MFESCKAYYVKAFGRLFSQRQKDIVVYEEIMKTLEHKKYNAQGKTVYKYGLVEPF